MVIAHATPASPNWIDTEGRPFAMVFWRFFLPEGPIETPQARRPFSEIRARVAAPRRRRPAAARPAAAPGLPLVTYTAQTAHQETDA